MPKSKLRVLDDNFISRDAHQPEPVVDDVVQPLAEITGLALMLENSGVVIAACTQDRAHVLELRIRRSLHRHYQLVRVFLAVRRLQDDLPRPLLRDHVGRDVRNDLLLVNIGGRQLRAVKMYPRVRWYLLAIDLETETTRSGIQVLRIDVSDQDRRRRLGRRCLYDHRRWRRLGAIGLTLLWRLVKSKNIATRVGPA